MSEFNKLDEEIKKLSIQKFLDIEKSLTSKDPNEILKAQKYITGMQSKGDSKNNMKAFMFDPFDSYGSGAGFKRSKKRMSFDVMKKVSEIPYVWVILKTRIFQVQNFLKFVQDDQQEGYTIRRKISRFEERKKKVSKEDQKTIEYIIDFLENSRMPSDGDSRFDAAKWDEFEDLDDFVRLILKDSLAYDQLAFENQRNNKFELMAYKAIDASTVRMLDTIDPRYRDHAGTGKFGEMYGYFPKYGQVWGSEIQKDPITNEPIVWYPWELSMGIRNKTTDISKNFYGTSEIEIAYDLITWVLYGMQYNGNFFKQGSNPKGILNLKDGAEQINLNEFRQMWRTQIAGVDNSHKIPIVEGADLEWINFQMSNKDMEFQPWIEFLIMILCSVYSIDPSELGLNFKNSNQMFGQDGQKERLQHSRDKGLKPLLVFIQKIINKFIVSEIDRDFEFVFTGVDIEDEEAKVANDKAKLDAGLVSLQDMFKKYSDRDINLDDDIILNQIYAGYKQMMMQGSPESNAAVDDMTAGEEDYEDVNVFDEYEKASKQDPIIKACKDHIDKAFSNA